MQMDTAIEKFVTYLRSRYPQSTTARQYGYDLQRFCRWSQELAVEALTVQEVRRFVDEQLQQGLAPTTINRELAALHGLFEYLAQEEGHPEWPNPVQWHRHRIKEGQTQPRDVSEDNLTRLFGQIQDPRDRALFRLLLDTGLRVSEVVELRVEDLQVQTDGQRARLRVQGKGSKERFVWVVGETLELLQTWLSQRPAVESQALFITRRRQPFSVRGIQERLTHYAQQADLEVSPHQLRHSFGRRMAEADMPVTSLAALLGHEQVTTTQTYIQGAALDLQADYQAAIAHWEAERLEPPAEAPLQTPQPPADVWTLAGVAPTRTEAPLPQIDPEPYWQGLPAWLIEYLRPYIHSWQSRWKPSQRAHHTRIRLQTLRQIWDWLLRAGDLTTLGALERAQLQAYVDARLAAGTSPATVNRELSEVWAFLRFCSDRGVAISPAVFRVPRPKEAQALPRFLPEETYRRLEQHVFAATQASDRSACLDRLWFLLLSHTGLRVSEVCDLQLEDLDLSANRLVVRSGKGNRDRTVPLSPALQAALRAYLPLRGSAPTDHLLIHAQRCVSPVWIQRRLRVYGRELDLAVSPHRLRHTLATRLLNQGMPITSLQHLLGHDDLMTTLRYARIHNATVQRDYEQAYAQLYADPTLPTESDVFDVQLSEDNCA